MFINVLCEVYEEYLEGYILLNMGSILLLQSEYSQRVFRSYITSSDMVLGVDFWMRMHPYTYLCPPARPSARLYQLA